MSDGYRDDGTGTEDWGVTRITEQIAAWPGSPAEIVVESWNELPIPAQKLLANVSRYYTSRLRTTAEALCRLVHECEAEFTLDGMWSDNGQLVSMLTFSGARAVLAQLEKEGLA